MQCPDCNYAGDCQPSFKEICVLRKGTNEDIVYSSPYPLWKVNALVTAAKAFFEEDEFELEEFDTMFIELNQALKPFLEK